MKLDSSHLDGRPIRVLQLGSPAGMFGAERWIMALVKHLPRDRVESIIGVIQDERGGGEPPLCAHARNLGFETLVIRAPGRVSASAVQALRRAAEDLRLDVVHTHFYKPTILSAWALYRERCKLIATPHGWSADAGLKVQCYEWLERLAFGRADAVAPLSRDLEEPLNRLPWLRGKVHLIANGVDLSEVTASRRIADEVELIRQSGRFVIGYIGQLIERKRIDTLIRALSQLPGANAHLFIVGDGDQRTELQRLTQELGVTSRVTFSGFRDDRLDFLRGFDVLVLPSTLEGIPRCLMEAMAATVPVVGSRIPGIADLIIEGTSGLMFDAGDVEQLVSCLSQLEQDVTLRSYLARGGNERVTRMFSAESMASGYLSLYQKTLGRAIS